MKFLASFEYLQNLKAEVRRKVRESRGQRSIEEVRREAQKHLQITFDFEEVIHE